MAAVLRDSRRLISSTAPEPEFTGRDYKTCMHRRVAEQLCLSLGKGKTKRFTLFSRRFVVRVEGLEPPQLSSPEPKSGASTNSAIPALFKSCINNIWHMRPSGARRLYIIRFQERKGKMTLYKAYFHGFRGLYDNVEQSIAEIHEVYRVCSILLYRCADVTSTLSDGHRSLDDPMSTPMTACRA